MSVSHPSLNQLKTIVRSLYSEQKDVLDGSESLQKLCACLESIFFFGTYEKPETTAELLWESICRLPLYYERTEFPSSVEACIKFVLDSKDVQTHRGRLRLLIRCALQRRVLHVIIGMLVRRNEILKGLYDNASLLGDQILSEILVASLAVLKQCNFKLLLKNSAFLDQQWNLPLYKMYELVPCNRIGLDIRFTRGYVVVVKVEPGSVADEDLRIEPGDFIDELFGKKTYNMSKATFLQLLLDYKRQPVYIGVMKCLDDEDKLYAPMKPILASLKLSKDILLRRRLEKLEETAVGEGVLPVERQPAGMDSCCGRVLATYRGSSFVEDAGSEVQLGAGIMHVMSHPTHSRQVVLSLLSTKVVVRTVDTNETLFEHGFPQIVCCGRRADSRISNCTHRFCHVYALKLRSYRGDSEVDGFKELRPRTTAILSIVHSPVTSSERRMNGKLGCYDLWTETAFPNSGSIVPVKTNGKATAQNMLISKVSEVKLTTGQRSPNTSRNGEQRGQLLPSVAKRKHEIKGETAACQTRREEAPARYWQCEEDERREAQGVVFQARVNRPRRVSTSNRAKRS